MTDPQYIAADLFGLVQEAAAEGLEPNLRRFLRFRGDSYPVELQFLDRPVRWEENGFAHAPDEHSAIALAQQAEGLGAQGCYAICNSIKPAVATRAESGEWHLMKKGQSTTDADIVRRCALYIDIDAGAAEGPNKRPAGTSATEAELRSALIKTDQIVFRLASIVGWESLGVGCSGNGGAAFVALDHLPETPELKAAIDTILTALDVLHSDESAHVDTSVGDAKRLCPLFGTTKRKGAAGNAERPHRRTAFFCASEVRRLGLDELFALRDNLLAQLTGEQRAAVEQQSVPSTTGQQKGGRFARAKQIPINDVANWLGLLEGESVRCSGCGTLGTSSDTSVQFFRNGLKCFHASCVSKGRKGFRTTVDLVMEVRNVDKNEAVRLLADQFGFSSGPSLQGLIYNEKGGVKQCVANVMTVLAGSQEWEDVIAYDEFAESVVKLRPPPVREQDAVDDPEPGDWTDEDSTRTAAWIASRFGFAPTSQQVDQAVNAIAHKHLVHPVREYLQQLQWDGKPRLDLMLSTYFGGKQSPYTATIGSKWMISAVARVFEPGCQADCMLVLESLRQGRRKSTGMEALAGKEWFADTGIAVGEKDSYQSLRRKWIYELGELDAIRGKEATKVKSFISARVDNYRPSYGRRNRDFRRQNVFVGTTNEDRYLVDRTGNRRFWPVRCERDVGIEAIKRDRDQLWAEARIRYENGERWYVDAPLLRRLCEEEQRDREIPDDWTPIVRRWLEAQQKQAAQQKQTPKSNTHTGSMWSDVPPTYATFDLSQGVTTGDVLRSALDIKPEKMTQAHTTRVGHVLRDLGWEPRQVRVGLGGLRERCYFPTGQVSGQKAS